jgi:hypothetical protein
MRDGLVFVMDVNLVNTTTKTDNYTIRILATIPGLHPVSANLANHVPVENTKTKTDNFRNPLAKHVSVVLTVLAVR